MKEAEDRVTALLSNIPKSFLPSARNSMNKKFSLDTGDNLGMVAGRLSVRQKKTINFDAKEDPFDQETIPIMSRRRARKLAKGDGEDLYDNEKQTSENDDEDDGLMFMSQQLEEDYNIMMSPKRQELQEYLEVDERFMWQFANRDIKVGRSLSLDKAVPYEMAEGEYIPKP